MRPNLRRLAVLHLVLLLAFLSGCDIGMTDDERLERAGKLAAAGDLPAAIIETRSVLQDDPVNLKARLALARIARQAGDSDTAAKEFGRAIDLGASIDEIRYEYLAAMVESGDYRGALELSEDLGAGASARELSMRGRALAAAGDRSGALAIYRMALDADRTSDEARIGLAELHVMESRYGVAKEELDAVSKGGRLLSRYHEVRGLLLLRSGEPDAAVAAFGDAIAAAGPDPFGMKGFPLRGRLAESALVAGDLEKARAVIAQLLANAPENPAANYLKARLELQSGQPAEALKYTQSVLAVQPDFAPARIVAAVAALDIGNPALAENYVGPVVAANPENRTARQLLARAQIAMGRPASAMTLLSPLAGSEQDLQTLGLLTEASVQAGQMDEAVERIQKQLELDRSDTSVRLHLASTLLRSGRPDEAIAALEGETFFEGSQFQRDFLLLQGRLQTGDFSAADEVAGRIVSASAEQPARLGLIADAYAFAGRLDESTRYYQMLLDTDEQNTGAMRGLARVRLIAGDSAGAAAWLEQAIDIDPSDATLLTERAKISLAATDRGGATAYLLKAIEAEPQEMEARRLLTRLYLAEGRNAEAEAVAREALVISQDDPDTLNSLGLAQLAQNDLEGAQSSFAQASAASPTSSIARFNLGRAQLARGEVQAAAATIEEAVALDPDALLPSATLVTLRIAQGDLAGARLQLESLRSEHPDAEVTHLLKAELAFASGDFSAAEQGFRMLPANDRRRAMGIHRVRRTSGQGDAEQPLEEWVRENPDDSSARLLLAQSLGNSGRRSDAIEQYSKALEAEPDNPAALNNLAWLYLEQGDPRAVEIAERAYELAPESAAIKDTFGWALFKQGERDRARVLIEEAMEAAPEESEVRYHLAVILADLGESEDAIRLAREILADEKAVDLHDDVQAVIDDL